MTALPPQPPPSAPAPAASDADDVGRRLQRQLGPVPGYDVVRGLQLTGGDGALLERVLRRYVQSYASGAPALIAAAAAGDVAACRSASHALRGASAAVGAQTLAAQLQSLERAWQLEAAPEPAVLRDQVHLADAALRALVQQLEQALSSP